MSRKYTNKLLEMIEECLVGKDFVIMACMQYMSEYDVRDMMQCNDLLDEENEEESDEE